MSNLIWVGIVVVVIIIIIWIKIRSSNKNSYNMSKSSDNLWGKVKDACCVRGR